MTRESIVKTLQPTATAAVRDSVAPGRDRDSLDPSSIILQNTLSRQASKTPVEKRGETESGGLGALTDDDGKDNNDEGDDAGESDDSFGGNRDDLW